MDIRLYPALRNLLFATTDPETTHTDVVRLLARLSQRPAALRVLRRVLRHDDPALVREVCGLRFANAVGLAAGYDKDGLALPAWAALGFGHVEVGTVTWHAQPGNPRPRLHRLPRSCALINRMGFNNAGAATLVRRLRALTGDARSNGDGVPPLVVGISLGKSRRTALAQAAYDYCASLRILYPYGDYFAVNVSSPNTPGLRDLQQRDQLDSLLATLQRESRWLAAAAGHAPRPLLVKVSPDLDNAALLAVLDLVLAHGIAGIIATNTTLRRDGLHERTTAEGGLSGQPLAARAREVVALLHREAGGRVPIIGVGGILTPDDALRMLDAGARLVQVYTGLVYHGPALPRNINRALSRTAVPL